MSADLNGKLECAGLSGRGLDKRKRIIFFCGVVIYFFTSMSKMLVPGSTFSVLQVDPGLTAGMITGLGAGYMYAYAASQLLLGLLSVKFGGVRILLFGGALFAFSSLLFPFLDHPVPMLLARCATGFGAGSVFIGLAKLMVDLFSDRYVLVFSITLFVAYLGPVGGSWPTVWCIDHFTWRPVLTAIALVPCALTLAMLAISPGTFKPVLPGNSCSQLAVILREKAGLKIFFCSSIVFCIFYAVLTSMGQKALVDCAGFSQQNAAWVMTAMALLMASANLLASPFVRWCGANWKLPVLTASGLILLASLLATAGLFLQLPYLIAAAFLLTAVPSGSFSVFSSLLKGLFADCYAGLAVALLNFCAFVAIAAGGNIAGAVFHLFQDSARQAGQELIYPPETYGWMFVIFSALAAAGLLTALTLKKTGTQPKQG